MKIFLSRNDMNLWFGHMVTLFTGKHCTERTFHLNHK